MRRATSSQPSSTLQYMVRQLVLTVGIAMLFPFPSVTLAESPGPLEIWQDFDPDAGDFKEEIVREETKNGVYYRDAYISAYHQDQEIRVYCRYAVKAGARKVPGLMDVHGWMGGPAPDRNYVSDGWAVMAHDYCGKTGSREHYTRYPESLRHGNMDNKQGHRIKSRLPDGSFISDARQTDDYLWYMIQRRVLSYLLHQKEVDPERIGAKGFSYGGTLMWNLGMDRRVKAVVAYFGIGWLEYYRSRRVWMYSQPAHEPAQTPGERLYLSAIAPQAHAPHITAASLWLNGTNDHHGGHERGEQTFQNFKSDVPWSFAHQPRGHHDTQDIGQNAKLWLEKHVLGKKIHWADQAESKIVLDEEGVPQIRIRPADVEQVSDVKIFYSLKEPVSYGRSWRDCELERSGDTWVGKMPVLNVDDYVFAFSNIRYKNSVVRSSPFTAAIPSKLGSAKATDTPSTKLDGTGGWANVGPVQGKGGVSGFRILSNRGTLNQQFNDPKWNAPAGSKLQFKFYCTQPQSLSLSVNNHYQAKVDFTASDDWQTMTLAAGRFINRLNNQPLKDWTQAARVDIKPTPGADITKVVFADFNWATPAQSSPDAASARQGMRGLAVVRGQLEPFLTTYCVRCHGAEEQNGQVRFDNVSWNIDTNDTAQRWQDVLDQLNGGDMPPEDEKQPSNAELATTLDSLTGALLEARRRLTDHGGEIKLRRLNKREYSNSIRDLFGFEVPADEIPDDGEIATFDTVGAEQFFTSSHFDKYLELGKRVAHESFRFNLSPPRKVTTQRTEVEKRVTQRLRDKLADLDRKMELKKAGATWQEMGFKDEGEMEIIFRQWDSRAELPRRYLEYPFVNTGVYTCDAVKWASAAWHIDIRGDYRIRIRGGVRGEPDNIRRIVRVWDRHRIRGTVQLAGTPQEPQIVEMLGRQPMGRSQLGVTIRENMPDNAINTMRGYLNRLEGRGEITDPRAAVWIDWIEIEGPFYPPQRPKWEDILYPGKPTGGRSPYIWDDSKIPELIEKFAFEAFRRRKPEPEYVTALHDLYQQNRQEGKNQRDSLIEVMGVVLASPGFLFLQEEATPDTNSQQLSNRELAVRLSYFLWSSPPDNELYNANLADPTIYATQVDRLLDDPRATAFRDGFISQWAELDRYDAITVDNQQHIRFNEGLQQDAKQEVREFFGALIKEDLPAANLIQSDFVVINSALAAHYGIELPNSKDSSFRKVMLPATSPRGGLMTQAAFLVTGSNGERSSPVIRGALVMEKLLHDKPAPPPPNVPELGAASEEPKTNREMVELHQRQAVCASCHKKMDVIGFGLENFDTIGRWRDAEQVGRKQIPIQPGGTLPNGSEFSNVRELKSVLLTHEDQLAKELVESILAYALGRTIEFSDSDDVDQIMSQLKPKKYPIRAMIREVALSPLFKKQG